MTRTLLVLAVLALVGFIAFRQLGNQPVDARSTIDSGVSQVKEQSDLNPEQEMLLRIQLAWADYTASNGQAPGSIDQLVPKYFDSVPINPRTQQAFVYPPEEMPAKGGSEGQVVAVSADTSDSSVADAILEAEGFVNPNTMKESTFVYDPSGKRDPFEPFDFSGRSNVDTTLPPLERYSLGQLKVTAILKDSDGEYYAFIEDATGVGYPARKGTKIGNENGVVVLITEKAVSVVETTTSFTGEVKRKTVEMKIHSAVKEDKNAKFQRIRNSGGRRR